MKIKPPATDSEKHKLPSSEGYPIYALLESNEKFRRGFIRIMLPSGQINLENTQSVGRKWIAALGSRIFSAPFEISSTCLIVYF